MRVVMPTNTWQAYNAADGYSFYFGDSYGTSDGQVAGEYMNTGTSRGVKLSFARRHLNFQDQPAWPLHAEFPLVYWLERMGYDIAYVDDQWLDRTATTSMRTKALVIAGHSEYWTQGMRDHCEQARAAGIHLASFSANTGYWRVRYEDNQRSMVCFKTIEGTYRGTDPGANGVNDFGQDRSSLGTGAGSAVGPDKKAGTADDNRAIATTTFRDPGAGLGATQPDGLDTPNDPNSKGVGRVGIGKPESQLWGVQYIGDTLNDQVALRVPARSTSRPGEFTAHTIWRNTPIANATSAKTLSAPTGEQYVGWEWDAIPAGPLAASLGAVPSTLGLKVVAETPLPVGPDILYLHDAGRYREADVPTGQPRVSQAVTYKASSGALVFASGSMRWSLGLGPHFRSSLTGHTFKDPRIDGSRLEMQQATYNLFADMLLKPNSPHSGIVLDTRLR
jgi:hypothetical protein